MTKYKDGTVNILGVNGGGVQIRLGHSPTFGTASWYSAEDLTAAIATLTQIRDAMQEQDQ